MNCPFCDSPATTSIEYVAHRFRYHIIACEEHKYYHAHLFAWLCANLNHPAVTRSPIFLAK